MHDVQVHMKPPHDFDVAKKTDPPVALPSGSTWTGAWLIRPPVAANLHTSHTETRIFVFEFSYVNPSAPDKRVYRSTTLDLDLSQSRLYFDIYAWLGLVIGGLIKMLGKYREISLAPKDTSVKPWSLTLVVPFVTTLVVGFIVVLVLSKDKLPTRSYYDTIALSVTVALISDDQLLLRVSSVVPR